jgi:hypothetical protein
MRRIEIDTGVSNRHDHLVLAGARRHDAAATMVAYVN